uniref:hypothetical protein n=1 Tax=Mycoplasmopsis bovis TaxID=28903 RepID=UPI003D2733AC
LSIGVPRPDNKGFVYRLGYGYLHELKQYHDDPLPIDKYSPFLTLAIDVLHCLFASFFDFFMFLLYHI